MSSHQLKKVCFPMKTRLLNFLLMLVFFVSLIGASDSHAQEGNLDLLPPELRGELNQSISQILNGFFIFSSTDAVSSGRYHFKNRGEDSEEFQVLKASGIYHFGNNAVDEVTPFISGQIGTFNQQEELSPLRGSGENDFSRVNSVSAGLGAGVSVKIFKDFFIRPEFHAVYTHTENDYDYNNQFSQEILKLFDGDLFNWNIDTVTYMPSVGVGYEGRLESISFLPSVKYTHMFIDSTSTDSELLDVSTSTGVLNSRLETRIPLSRCLLEKELEVRPFISRTDIYRDARVGLGFGSFYQSGLSIVLATEDSIPYVSSLGIGGSYAWNSDFEGWRLGFEVELA